MVDGTKDITSARGATGSFTTVAVGHDTMVIVREIA